MSIRLLFSIFTNKETPLQFKAMALRRLYNFRIDPDLDDGLKLVKERDHIPESQQIRLALREWLEKRKAIKTERPRVATRKRS